MSTCVVPVAERNDHPAAGGELLDQRRRDLGRRRRHQDRVVRGERDASPACRRPRAPSTLRIPAASSAARAPCASAGMRSTANTRVGQQRQQRRLVAGARADLEHPLPAREPQQLEVARLHPRLRDGLPAADGQRRRPRRRGAARSAGTKRCRGTMRTARSTARSRIPLAWSVSTSRRPVAAVAVARPYPSSAHPRDRLEEGVVGQVHVQRRDRDVALGHRQVVGVLACRSR